jgi:fibronectin type 3 domain-containing protein
MANGKAGRRDHNEPTAVEKPARIKVLLGALIEGVFAMSKRMSGRKRQVVRGHAGGGGTRSAAASNTGIRRGGRRRWEASRRLASKGFRGVATLKPHSRAAKIATIIVALTLLSSASIIAFNPHTLFGHVSSTSPSAAPAPSPQSSPVLSKEYAYAGGKLIATEEATGGPAIPGAPTGLTATAGNAQVSLAWTASSGATSYNVKRSTISGGSYTTIASGVTATSYLNTGLTNGTTYYFVVTAVNAAGESGNSNEASATPASGPTPPSPPTGLTATAGNAQVSLAWTASSGATSYNVKRSTISGGSYTTIASGVTATSYTNTGLTNGTTYYFVVTAVNTAGESGNSNEASATPTAGSPPPAPTGLTATGGNAQVSLSWSASSGATSYNVKRATVNGGPYSTIASGVTATGYTNTGLTNGTTYYYVVSAVNGAGESGNSNQASATPSGGGGSPCDFVSFSPATRTVTNTGGAFSVSVTSPTPAGCSWTATSNVSWITITSGGSGSGAGTINYAVAQYTGGSVTRSGKITITLTQGTATHTVKQTP